MERRRTKVSDYSSRTVLGLDALAGTDRLREALDAGTPAPQIIPAWQPDLEAFRASRQR